MNKSILVLGLVAAVVYCACLATTHLIRDFADKRRNQPVTASRLKILGLGVLEFAGDHHGRFPPMSDSGRFRGALEPYAKGAEGYGSDFVDVEHGAPFVLNVRCSGIDSRALSDAPGLIVLYQHDPAPSGYRLALFADGHVKGVGAAAWASARGGPGQQEARAGRTGQALTLVPRFGSRARQGQPHEPQVPLARRVGRPAPVTKVALGAV